MIFLNMNYLLQLYLSFLFQTSLASVIEEYRIGQSHFRTHNEN